MHLRTALIFALFAALSLLAGCALLDEFFLEPLSTPEGDPLYELEAGGRVELTTSPVDPATGEALPRARSAEPAEGARVLQNSAEALGGPWGGAAGGAVGLLVGLYAALRGRKKLRRERAVREATGGALTVTASVLQDLATGAIDADRNGKVSAAEIGDYIRERIRRYASQPESLERLLGALAGTLSETERRRALEEAAR